MMVKFALSLFIALAVSVTAASGQTVANGQYVGSILMCDNGYKQVESRCPEMTPEEEIAQLRMIALLRASARAAAGDHVRRTALQEQLVAVRHRLGAVQATLGLAEPKSVRSRRSIKMPALVVKTLKAHRVGQLEERLAAGTLWVELGFVFTTSIGTPLDARNVIRAFSGVVTTANLPALRFHDLRHTAALLLLAQGVSPRTIMETLGHSQISLTMDTYAHIMPTLQQAAAQQMNAILTR